MPVSTSETRNRWRKRKKEPPITRKSKPQDEDYEEEDDEDNEDLDQHQEIEEEPHPRNPRNSSDPMARPVARENYEVLSDGGACGVRISDFPPVVKRLVSRPHSSVLAIAAMEKAAQSGDTRAGHQNGVVLENVSYGQLQALCTVPRDSPSLGAGDQDGSSAYVITPPPILEGRGVVKNFARGGIHAVPMHADWFSPNTVHRLERQVVPHFFSGKSPDHTPEKYMHYRNCIVGKYMENPDKRLSFSDCQGSIVGVDIDDLTRIVRFLDQWGIINYCAPTSYWEPLNDGTYLSEDPNGDLRVPATSLKSIDSLIQFDKPKCRLKAADVYPLLANPVDEKSDLDSRIRERLSENHCNCCSRPLSVVYYQSQKEVDVMLCLDCFHEGRFVTGHSSLDFVRVDSTKEYGDLDGETWTDQETLLLLEAMELYNDNWNEIAEHVGTKSKAQCILQFIRLPMDDAPLENVDIPSTAFLSNLSNKDDHGRSHSNSNGDLGGSSLEEPDRECTFPFANSGNPVMTLVSFLTASLGPRVAAACAHASLAFLSEDNLAASLNIMQADGSGSGNREVGPHGEITNLHQQRDENMGVHGQWNQCDTAVAPLYADKVRAAAKAGLSAAATKAKLFADHEEREIQRLSANIVNHQLKRLELKLKQFAEVETLLMKECEQVERMRQRIATERAHMGSTQFGSTESSRPVGMSGVGPPMVNNNTGNNRQQVIPGSPSLPFLPGYGNNQPIHPHMSLMQQQPMYGLEQRLPLSTIHSSPSAPPNVVGNAAASSQSSISHPMLRPLSGAKSGLG